MSAWRRKAIELLPEQRVVIDASGNPVALWVELHSLFHYAVKEEQMDWLGRLFAYADWCWKESRSVDGVNGALIGCYESIPWRKEHWWTAPAFISTPDFYALEDSFRYGLNEEQYQEFSAYYHEGRKKSEKSALKRRKDSSFFQ